MNKIKIVHILHSVGGVDTSLRMITEHLDPSRFENVIIHGKKDNGNFVDRNKNKIKSYSIPIERNINPTKDLISIVKALKIVKKEKPNLIHGHSAKGGIIANSIGYLLKSLTVFHTPQAYSYLSTSNRLKRKLFIYFERLVKNKNSVLLASSESELTRGLSDINYSRDKALLFNNCINQIELNNAIDISEYNLPEEFICTVGRPSYQKNIELIVEIIKKVKIEKPNIHMVVMGLGVVSPNTEKVRSLIDKYNLNSNFTLIDWTERDKTLNIIAKSSFYISTARYEGLPYAIIESLSLSKAIVASDCDGNRDLVINKFNGFLLKENQKDDFVEKVIKLLDNKDLRQKFEKNSFSLFKSKFYLKYNIKQLERIYLKYS